MVSDIPQVVRDGRHWRLGTPAEVAWIEAGTAVGLAITSAIPPVFEAYATILIPEAVDNQVERHESALLSVLREHSADQPWWLGYLDTGADEVVFADAPRVNLYAEWPYVLVMAGPDQAATWRRWDCGSFWLGHLPNLMFPADRGWLLSTLWDDDWTCVGGSAALVDALTSHPELRSLSRQVTLDQDATPPGHRAI
ncbi:hypothetical protein [Fodinicola acaciae]|uniref:hypothetical protein n=1 Tax=Fodinicola acaciae TaxID=2681555 RepID=UPI001C9E1DED|nr:hypothetical protein [Fodinicola acaciae]